MLVDIFGGILMTLMAAILTLLLIVAPADISQNYTSRPGNIYEIICHSIDYTF